MKNLLILLLLLGVSKINAQNSDYEKSFNASIQLIKNNIEKNIQISNNVLVGNQKANKTKPLNTKVKYSNLTSATAFIDKANIKILKHNSVLNKVKRYKTEGRKTQLIKHNPELPKPINSQSIGSLKALLNIPK